LFLSLSLPVEDRFFMGDRALFKEWAKRLDISRDSMDNLMFDQLVRLGIESGTLTVIRGNMRHSDLSDILEGLIIWLTSDSGTEVLKYKFPKYTRMTMLIRTLIGAGHISAGHVNWYRVIEEIEKWAQKWVVDPKNRSKIVAETLAGIWIGAKSMDQDFPLNGSNYLDIFEPAMQKARATGMVIDPTTLRGPQAKLILVIGPVGFGKSRVLEQLKNTGYLVVEVDHDSANTPASAGMKNQRLLKTIWTALAQGKPVVVANGGGLFAQKNKAKAFELTIIDSLAKAGAPFPITVSAIICFENFHDPKLQALMASTAVVGRIARSEYTIDPTVSKKVKGKAADPILPGTFVSEKAATDIFVDVSIRNTDCQKFLISWAGSNGVPVTMLRPVVITPIGDQLAPIIASMPPTIEPVIVAATIKHKVTCGWHCTVGPWSGHITHAFGISMDDARTIASGPIPTGLTACRVTIAKTGDTKECHAYLITGPPEFDAQFKEDRPAHMSIDAPFEAVHNGRCVAIALAAGVGKPVDTQIDSKKLGTSTWTVCLTSESVPCTVIRSYMY
jgi:hypothetical protein